MNPKQREKPDILKKKPKQIKTVCKKVQDQGISNQVEDNLHPQAEESSDDGVVDIENLPIEIVMEIFKYLNLNDLCRVGRVCKTWHEMTRSRVYWERIQANIGESSLSMCQATFQLISILPSFVTCISLNFKRRNWRIEFNEFSEKLREKCPNLQILVLKRITFAIETDEIVQLCTKLPKDVRVLALPDCIFDDIRRVCDESDDAVSNIEVLHLCERWQRICSQFSFTHMPNLKKLHLPGSDYLHDDDFDNIFPSIGYFIDQLEILNLEGTPTSSITFETIINHSQHLTELYVCWTKVQDRDLVFIEEQKNFPCLKVICLRGCDVTTVGVYSLIKSCPTLQKIFVGFNSIFNDTWDIEKVEDLDYGQCDHSKKVNYMRK